MQWLIDIIVEKVIAEIGIPPVYIDRGDPADADFVLGDFTRDNEWYSLDLSAIVPEGATSIHARTLIRASTVAREIQLRKISNENEFNTWSFMTQVAGLTIASDAIVAVGANRIIEYKIDPALNQRIDFVVAGWWL